MSDFRPSAPSSVLFVTYAGAVSREKTIFAHGKGSVHKSQKRAPKLKNYVGYQDTPETGGCSASALCEIRARSYDNEHDSDGFAERPPHTLHLFQEQGRDLLRRHSDRARAAQRPYGRGGGDGHRARAEGDTPTLHPPQHDQGGRGEKRQPEGRVFPQHMDGGAGQEAV